MSQPNLKTLIHRAGALLAAVLLLSTMSGSVLAQGNIQDNFYEAITENVSQEQLQTIADDTPWFDPTAGECGPIAGSDLATTGTQDGHARTIIGIAKTMGLGEEGALIGLMTALVESGLKNYANDGTWLHPDGFQPYKQLGPISTALPHDAVGNDHDSVGIMQQRSVDGNWGPVNPDENLAENVKWLMTPSYAAFAFFRALENLGDWQSLEPGVAAQRVQVSAYPDRYAERRNDAQGYLGRLWDQSPAIPLPDVADAEGAAVSQSDPAVCPVVSGGARDKILQTIALYAWPTYCDANRTTCPGREGTALTAKEVIPNIDEYRNAIRKAARNGEYIGDRCGRNVFTSNEVGADCGGFTTRVMRDSGVDPDFNTNPQSNTTHGQLPYLRRATAAGKYMEVTDLDALEPGDIAINEGHTYFYVGDAMQDIVPNWQGATASASQCERTAMAGPEDTRSNYTWFRYIGGGDTLVTDAGEKTGSPDAYAQQPQQPFPPLTRWSLTGRIDAIL